MVFQYARGIDRAMRRRVNWANRISGSGRIAVEMLEQRLLFSVSPIQYPDYILDPADAKTPLQADEAAALRDTQGPTLNGQGPLAKIGLDLAEVYEEYQTYSADAGAGSDAGSSTSPFAPSNPEMQVQGNTVVINASGVNGLTTLIPELVGLGMTNIASADDMVSGNFPIDALPQLAQLSDLQFGRAAYKPIVEAGSVESQGDIAMGALHGSFDVCRGWHRDHRGRDFG